MTEPQAERYCAQCQVPKPPHAYKERANEKGRQICRECENQNSQIHKSLKIADTSRKSLAAAVAKIERDAKASKINLPAISEFSAGLFSEFGGVREVCRLARELFDPPEGTPAKLLPTAKVRLDILKFIANLLLAAHQHEAQLGDLDEMSEQDLDDTIIQLAEMRGWKFQRPEVA